MAQALSLDRRSRRVYLALAVLGVTVAACAARPRSIAPAGLTPLAADTARRWVADRIPSRSLRYDLRWRYTTQQGSSAGRAAVRLAPPDTLRFDYRGPFGRAGSAVVVGSEVIWADPEDDAGALLPTAPLFWAALGVPLAPPASARVVGHRWPHQQAWRYVNGRAALDYIARSGPPRQFLAELREGDRIVGVTTMTYGDQGRHPAEARIVFPRDAALFQFTVEAVDTLATFSPDTWTR